MNPQFEIILVFVSVILGVISAAYFYFSANIFEHLSLLKKPLKLISTGMFIIAIGVLIGAYISYEAQQGINLYLYNVPLQVFFYILYIIGSVFIFLGARRFTHRAN